MATSTTERVTLTIPAGYVEDVRTALVASISSDGEMLATNHAVLLAEDDEYGTHRADLDTAARILAEDARLLAELVDATGTATLVGTLDAVSTLLDHAARLWSAQLAEQVDYGPVPMGCVAEITRRLAWAAEQSAVLEMVA